MWYIFKFEINILLILLMVIVVRSFSREHDRFNQPFVYTCYAVIVCCSMHYIESIVPYTNYAEVHQVLYVIESVLWIFIPYWWLHFVFEKLGYSHYLNQDLIIYLKKAPLVIVTLMACASLFMPILFKLNLFGDPVKGSYTFVMDILVALYSTASLALCLTTILLSSNSELKKYAMFLTIPTLICGGIQTFTFYNMSNIFYVTETVFCIITFINIHEDRVFIDALTGLNNRNRFKKYLSTVMMSSSVNRSNMYLTYIDVDEFKKINDNYGHVVGDLALRTVAEAMREVGAQTRSFIARLGGDEFAIISGHSNKEDYDKMVLTLSMLLDEKAAANFSEFKVKFSLGTTSLDIPNASMNDIIKIADRRMYEQKRIKKINNAQRNN